jgi:hypothetical protein
MHTLFFGQTLCGKTYLAKKIVAGMRRRAAVLTPNVYEDWPVVFQTHSIEVFLNFLRMNESIAAFVDECGVIFDQDGADDLHWLATTGRHLGHVGFFLATRYPHVPKTVRANCTTLYLFNSHPDDAYQLSRDFNCPELEAASELPQGHFLLKRSFEPIRRGVINFARGTVEIEKRR